MKTPRHMTMEELLALPVFEIRHFKIEAADDLVMRAEAFGGPFRDHDGAIWETCLIDDTWLRVPVALLSYASPAPARQSGRRTADGVPPALPCTPL